MKALQAYLELTKPKLTILVLATTSLGFWMASGMGMDGQKLLFTLLGAALLGGGINSLNQYLEKDYDALMNRTKHRPIPSGRIDAIDAFYFGAALSWMGIILLAAKVSSLCAMLGLATAFSYALFYTPLKRISPLNTLMGAVPGALPTLIGWGSAQGRLSLGAWCLFFILFAWQLPHFFSIAWVYREDYERSGFKMLTLTDADGSKTADKIVGTTILLILASLLPVFFGIAGNIYLAFAAIAGAVILSHGVYLRLHQMRAARTFMRLSIYYMIFIIIGMAADKLW